MPVVDQFDTHIRGRWLGVAAGAAASLPRGLHAEPAVAPESELWLSGSRTPQSGRSHQRGLQGRVAGQRPNPAVERDDGGSLGVDADRTSERRQCAGKMVYRGGCA